MPLEGDAKVKYQKYYMRGRRTALKTAEVLREELAEAHRKIRALQNELRSRPPVIETPTSR
jgi:hypothetical protein